MTVGLCLITKELTDELGEKLKKIAPYFDKIYVQCNGKDTDKLWNAWVEEDKITLSYYKWNDNFADARNALLKEVKTDWWLWIDTDDDVLGLENLRGIIQDAEKTGADSVLALYKYADNPVGESIADHWKDRLHRTAHPWTWKGAVHETTVSEASPKRMKTDDLVIVHNKTQEEFMASVKRNHKILVKEHKTNPDPRTTYYLAMSYFSQEEWGKATQLFIDHIRTSGWVEEQYRSWCKVAECHQKLGQLDKALSACMEAVKLSPEWPDAYFQLAFLYYELDDMTKSLEWNKVGMSKPKPDTLGIHDETLRYRAMMFAALAELSRGKVADAWELINMVRKASPKYPLMVKYYPLFEEAYYEHQAIDKAKWLIHYTKNNKGKPHKIIEGLGKLGLDIRLNPERFGLSESKKWPEKSIVFFCGGSLEAWGADTLDKGMGGSEEAIVYLSRELAKLGWDVTVFNDREDAYYDRVNVTAKVAAIPVQYLPWHLFNPRDEFDVIVAWRNTKFFTQYDIKARLKGVDLHDTPIGHQMINKEDVKHVDKYFFKSQMQRDMGFAVNDEQVAIIPNGIVREQFEEKKRVRA